MNLFEKQANEFADRHIGPNEEEAKEMLKEIGMESLEELINKTIPQAIFIKDDNTGIEAISEFEYLKSLAKGCPLCLPAQALRPIHPGIQERMLYLL